MLQFYPFSINVVGLRHSESKYLIKSVVFYHYRARIGVEESDSLFADLVFIVLTILGTIKQNRK